MKIPSNKHHVAGTHDRTVNPPRALLVGSEAVTEVARVIFAMPRFSPSASLHKRVKPSLPNKSTANRMSAAARHTNTISPASRRKTI